MVAPAPCVVRHRASSFGKEEPSLARPHFAGLPRLRHGIISPPLALGEGGVEVRPVRVRPFLVSIRAPAAPAPHPSYPSFILVTHTLPTTTVCASGTLLLLTRTVRVIVGMFVSKHTLSLSL